MRVKEKKKSEVGLAPSGFGHSAWPGAGFVRKDPWEASNEKFGGGWRWGGPHALRVLVRMLQAVDMSTPVGGHRGGRRNIASLGQWMGTDIDGLRQYDGNAGLARGEPSRRVAGWLAVKRGVCMNRWASRPDWSLASK